MSTNAQFVSVPTAADILGADDETVRQMFRDGRLKGYQTAGSDKRAGKIMIARSSLEDMGAVFTPTRKRKTGKVSAADRMAKAS